MQAALWEGERLLERRAYLAASDALSRVFGIAGEREELVKGLHHLAAAGYRAQLGEADRAGRQLELARRRLADFPDARPLVALVERDIESAGGELAPP